MDGSLVGQVQLHPVQRIILGRAAVIGGQEVGVAALLQAADNGAAHQACAAGDEYFVVFVHKIFLRGFHRRDAENAELELYVSLPLR